MTIPLSFLERKFYVKGDSPIKFENRAKFFFKMALLIQSMIASIFVSSFATGIIGLSHDGQVYKLKYCCLVRFLRVLWGQAPFHIRKFLILALSCYVLHLWMFCIRYLSLFQSDNPTPTTFIKNTFFFYHLYL